MILERRIESLSAEIAGIRAELGQTRDDLRRVLAMLGSLDAARLPDGSTANGRPGGHMASGDMSRNGHGAAPPNRGGLIVSQHELDALARAATASSALGSTAGDRQGKHELLSPQHLAQTLKEARSNGSRATSDADAPRISLDDLARRLKQLQNNGDYHDDGGSVPSLGRMAESLKQERAHESSVAEDRNLTMSLADLAGMMRDAQAGTLGGETAYPKAPDARQEKPALSPAEGPVKSPAEESADLSPVASLAPAGRQRPPKLDMNLVAGLTRWVGVARRTLGTRDMEALLGTYALAGHLTGAVRETICLVARMGVAPFAAQHGQGTQDDVIDVMLQLHGIVYGAGISPVGPAVEFDPAQMPLGDGAASSPPDADQLPPSGQEERRIEADANTTSTPAAANPEVETPSISPAVASFIDSISRSSDSGDLDSEQPAIDTPRHLSEAEWDRLEPVVPPTKPGGRPSKYDRREIMNGIVYQLRSGCSWRSLPGDLPPWKTVHHYYRTWRDLGAWGPISDVLDGLDRAAPAVGSTHEAHFRNGTSSPTEVARGLPKVLAGRASGGLP